MNKIKKTLTAFLSASLMLSLAAGAASVSAANAKELVNFSLSPLTTAYCDSVGTGGDAPAAIDGDYSTRWQSAATGNLSAETDPAEAWLYLDFGKERTFSEVKIYWETAHPTDKGFKLQTSEDGTTWNKDVKIEVTRTDYINSTESGYSNDTFYDDISTGTVTTRYLRVLVNDAWASGDGTIKEHPSIFELEVYGEEPDGYDAEVASKEEASSVITGTSSVVSSAPVSSAPAVSSSIASTSSAASEKDGLSGMTIGIIVAVAAVVIVAVIIIIAVISKKKSDM